MSGEGASSTEAMEAASTRRQIARSRPGGIMLAVRREWKCLMERNKLAN